MFTEFNDALIDAYLADHTAAEDEVLRLARERAAKEDMPPVPREVGSLLCLLVGITGSRNILEIGSGGGASGVWMCRGMGAEGSLTTIELDAEHQRLALESYQEAGFAERVRPLSGHALDVLPTLPNESFDFVFIDPAKAEYPEYLDHGLRLTEVGGLIVADNVLWSGRVVDPRARDPEDEGIRIFNRRISEDSRLHSAILPIGDGVSISLVCARQGRE